jgi:transcriptional regulator with XRE-family HTH domain
MHKSWDAFRKRLAEYLKPHGAVSEFSRKTGISRGTLDNWLDDEKPTAPTLEFLDKVAEGMGVDPRTLISPTVKRGAFGAGMYLLWKMGARPHQPAPIRIKWDAPSEVLSRLEAIEKRLPEQPQDSVLRDILNIWPKLDDLGREALKVAAEDALRELSRRQQELNESSNPKGTRGKSG